MLRTIKTPISEEQQFSEFKKIKDIESQIAEKMQELRSVKKSINIEIKKLEKQQKDLINVVRAGVISEEVECEEAIDLENEVIKIARVDTGEVVESRPLTEKEKKVHTIPEELEPKPEISEDPN